MISRPLRQLFEAVFHDKYRFDEFLSLDVRDHRSQVRWKNRTIFKPSAKLKEFHQFIGGFLLEYLPVDQSVSFAYRKGATLLQAVTPHARSRAFYQTDLERFFESITTDLIRSTFIDAVTPISDLSDHVEQILKLLTINDRLPIGYSTSPILSNACLYGFDRQLATVSNGRGWIYTRYADDIILSADNREALDGAGKTIECCLTDELGNGFKLNPYKTKLTTVGRRVKLLGLIILPTGAITIDREVRHRMETWLHFYLSDRPRLAKIFHEEHAEGMDEGLQRLCGLISYANAADPAYLSKLRIKFGNSVIDSFLRRSAQ